MAVTRVQSALERALRDLAACRARVALVGGLAVSARTEPRFTRDVDLAIAIKGDAEAEALVRALIERGYRVFAVAEHETAKRMATARLVGPSEDAEGVVVAPLRIRRAIADFRGA